MTLGQIIHQVDDIILDHIFQPLSDRISHKIEAFSLGSSFLIGSVIMQATSAIIPMVLFGSSLTSSIQNGLTLLCSIVITASFQKLSVLVKPGKPNPLRYMLFSLRIVVLFYSIICIILLCIRPSPHNFLIWEEIDLLSQIIFTIGLYFMSCQPRPPSWHMHSKKTALRPNASIWDIK